MLKPKRRFAAVAAGATGLGAPAPALAPDDGPPPPGKSTCNAGNDGGEDPPPTRGTPNPGANNVD